MTKSNDLSLKQRTKVLLWLVPMKAKLKPISIRELQYKKNLSKGKSFQFHHSRGYVRKVLSDIFNIQPLKVPLYSPPFTPPKLPDKWGYVSFSHCNDALFICWSSSKVGVDIEKVDRSIDYLGIMEKIFIKKEIEFFLSKKFNNPRKEFLKLWVKKEAAVKLEEGSIINDFKTLMPIPNKNEILNTSNDNTINSYLFEYKNWFLSLATKKKIIKNTTICIM